MGEEVQFVYNTRFSSGSVNFHTRLAEALANELERERAAEEVVANDEIDDFPVVDDDMDLNYMPDDGDASDVENDWVVEGDEVFDSDDSDDDEEIEEQNATKDSFLGKDGTIWLKNEPNIGVRLRHHNIMRFRPGPKEQNSVPIEVFKKFFTPNITFIIISETNRNGKAVVEKWNAANPSKKQKIWTDFTATELDAFVGILLAAGYSHNNMQTTKALWQSNNLPIFRAAMSFNRFSALARYIRFDDGRTRAQRLRDDKAAPIRDVWNFLNENLAKNYSPHDSITIDEQLFPYRGKTKFTQYIPSKPAKYGIKIWWACDSKSKYPLQGKLYTGRQEGEEREVNQGENVLIQLAKPYSNTGRTIVADNFFTTLEGVKRLARIGLAFVGTIRSNKRCIPNEMRKDRSRPVLSSLFGFHENLVSICSYVPKKNKCVNLLSTVHYTKHCEGEAMKPEAILFYNENKAGVDCMDQMVTHFTTKRSTRRWTFAFFCNMLDTMALAAFCICKEVDGLNKNSARRNFLTTLAETLVLPNIENRMNNIHIIKQFNTRLAMESYFGRPLNVSLIDITFALHYISFSSFFFFISDSSSSS